MKLTIRKVVFFVFAITTFQVQSISAVADSAHVNKYMNNGNSAEEARPLVEKISTNEVSSESTIQQKITLQGEKLFAFNSEFLGDSSKGVLIDLVRALENLNDIVSIDVIGHTDSSGSAKANRILSLKRAETVQSFLQGAYPELTINTSGVGEQEPAYPNSTVKGRRLNRRVEVIVTIPDPAS